MRTLTALVFAAGMCLASSAAFSQCNGRYYDRIFPGFFNWENFPLPTNLPPSVVYGSAVNYRNVTETLDMYIFQPQGDTVGNPYYVEKRPLIVLAFGGSFIMGAKESPDIIALCNEFTRRGFVTASIKYRIGADPIDSVNMLRAVMRGVQDARAAIRFFYKDAATTNTYRIDTNNIFMGGVSAGAFIGIHLGFITDSLETPQWLNDIVRPLGGFEGNSGNPGYSSKVRGIINLAGAIGDTAWIDACDPPMVSMHGTDDGTVPYCSEVIAVSGNELIVVDGSATIKSRMAHLGLNNPFYTWRGGGHVDFTNYFLFQSQYKPFVDTTIWFIRDFLYEELTGISCDSALRNQGTIPTPCGTPIEYGSKECSISAIKPDILNNDFSIYPNPSGDKISVTKPQQFTGSVKIEVFDNLGRLIKTYRHITDKAEISKKETGNGMFIIAISPENTKGEIARGKILFQ